MVEGTGSGSCRCRSKKAEFFPDQQILVLEGDAKLSRGQDVVEGYRVVYHLGSEEIEVSQVQGVVKNKK